jgi:chemotaxis protein methyltransferase CheR
VSRAGRREPAPSSEASASAPSKDEFAALFQAIAARLGLRVEGYRRVRGTVEKRLRRRLPTLGLARFADYERYLAAHPDEWAWVLPRCRITISRFARDRAVFERLVRLELPACAAAARARGQSVLRIWSAGTASGEEAYGVAIAWQLELAARYPDLSLDLLGTDADPVVLARAERGVYPSGSLRELPEDYRAQAFEPRGAEWALCERFRAGVRFEQADLRQVCPSGPFEMVLCRNLAFTYFDEAAQRHAAQAIAAALAPAGVLVVGSGENVPVGVPGFEALAPCFYRARILPAGERAPADPVAPVRAPKMAGAKGEP